MTDLDLASGGRQPPDPDIIRGLTPPARRAAWVAPAAYALMLAGAVGAFVLIQWLGRGLVAPEAPAGAVSVAAPKAGSVDVVLHVLATLAAVIALGFVLGRLMRRLGQPPVIGEVLAGILLGPSLLGAISPEAMHLLVPAKADDPGGQVLAALRAVAQLGVVLYMFLVGLELDAGKLRHQAHSTVAISHASIVLPFVLGSGLALVLYPVLSHRGVPFTSFALFLGAALAVTAFPVLARILADRGLDKTEAGTVALGCAAADDVTAWCLLAFVVGVAKAEVGAAVATTAGAAAFIGVMFFAVRPVAAWACRKLEEEKGPHPLSPSPAGGGGTEPEQPVSSLSLLRGGGRGEGSSDRSPLPPRGRGIGGGVSSSSPPPAAVPVLLIAVLLCALATEAIGVHAVFGAFLLGAVLPHTGRLAREVTAKLKDVVTVLLLPAFFALTGLRTEIGLVSGWGNWLLCGLIILAATAGKWGGTYAAARFSGYDRRTAAALGAMMNTRGLMGLIVLDVGLGMGVISPALFAMMVLMALATTLATAPALRRLIPPDSSSSRQVVKSSSQGSLGLDLKT